MQRIVKIQHLNYGLCKLIIILSKMKNTQKIIFSTANVLLAGLLTMLGFSCSGDDSNDHGNSGMTEYGTPSATFVIKGKVVSDTGAKLAGIRIITKSSISFSNIHKFQAYADTIFTDNKGDFSYTRERAPLNGLLIPIISEDVSGMYVRDSSVVDFKTVKFKGSSDFWFKGTAEKETTITLKKSNKK